MNIKQCAKGEYKAAIGNNPKDIVQCQTSVFLESNRGGASRKNLASGGMMMNDLERYYDLISHDYADEWYTNTTMLPAIREFLSLFDEKPRILDLGCGPGAESKRLAECGAEVVGIDISGESIRIAKSKNPDLAFYKMDYSEIDRKIGMFDGIFSCASMIHMKREEIEQSLKLLFSIQKDKGCFLIIYRKGKGERIQNPEINGEKLTRVIHPYSADDMKEIFHSNGYKYVKDGILAEDLKQSWHSQIYRKN